MHQGTQTEALSQPRRVGKGGRRQEGGARGRVQCIPTGNSC